MTWKHDVSTFLEVVSSICAMIMDSIAWTKLFDIFRNSSNVMLCSLPKIKAIRLVIFCNDVISWRWWLWWNSSVMFWKSVHFLLSINVLSFVELRAMLEKMIGWNFSSQKWNLLSFNSLLLISNNWGRKTARLFKLNWSRGLLFIFGVQYYQTMHQSMHPSTVSNSFLVVNEKKIVIF